MMLLAAPAWAQEPESTVQFYFEDNVNPFTDNTRITSAIEYDEVRGSNVLGWTCAGNAMNSYAFSYYDFSDALVEKTEEVQIRFKYYNVKDGRSILSVGDADVRGETGGSSRQTYNGSGAFFRIGSEKNNAFICDENYSQDDICNQWLYVNVVVSHVDKTVYWDVHNESFSFHKAYTGEYYSDDAKVCSQIDVFGYINNARCGMIDDLQITCVTGNFEYANYTIRYVDLDENELKPSRIAVGAVDHPVDILPSDKENFYSEDGTKKYILEDIDDIGMGVEADGSTVVTIYFREAETYYAVLNCMASGSYELLNKLTGTFFEGDELTLYPSRGYGKGGKYYFAAATNSWNGITYTFPRNITPSVVGGKTTYSAILFYEEDKTVAYYSDFERLALPTQNEGNGTGLGQLYGTVNSWWSFSNGYFERFSGGRGIRLDAGSYVWTEPIAEDGTYMVRIYGRNDKSANCEQPYALGYRDAEGKVTLFDVAVPDWGSATTGESVVGSVEEASGIGIKAGWSLVVMNTGNGDMISLDDIKLTKVAGYTETPILLGPRVVYTEFVEETGTLTYFYDGQREKRTGVTELYDPINDPDAVRFAGYYKKVTKVAIDPSMKRAPLTSFRNMSYGGYDSETWTSYFLPNVTSIEGLENLNTEIVTDMNSMFIMYTSLEELDLSSFNTSNVTNMNGMFLGCAKLKELDLSSFDVSNVEDMRMMFGSCNELTTIYCEQDWSEIVPPNNELENDMDNMYVMFSGCKKLVGSRGTAFDGNVINGTYARPDGGTKAPGYFTKKEVYTEFAEETGTLTFYYDNQMASREGVIDIYDPTDLDAPRFDGYSDNVLKAVIDPSMQEAPLASFESMFCGSWNDETHRYNNLSQMTTVEGLGNLNTDGVMSTRGMFANCEALTSLDFSSFNTSYVMQMDQMFLNCQSLTSLDLSTFNTEQVITMEAMFYHCFKLQMVDLTSFNISNVYNMAFMFGSCKDLTTICCYDDWSGTSANTECMFDECSSLVGGMGTTYNPNFEDATYARPDGGTDAPGYFTAETITSIKATDNGQRTTDGEIYNLAGQRLSKPTKGINIVGDKKIIVK